MAQSLNPSKTLDLNQLRLSNSPSGSPLPVKSISKLLKKKKIPSIMVYASSKMSSTQHQTPLSLSLQALTDGDRKTEVMNTIKNSVSNCLSETHLDLTVPGLKSKTRGKVRDIYDGGDYLVLVTTDRQSAFDRILASIPFKGQVLNETSLWWFSETQHITPNAVVSSPDKNVTIAKKCSVFPVEFVVRGYVTGSTDTSLWTVYKNGVRNYCGNALPDGLVKNQKLPENILTPTTKAADHDVPVTPQEIVQRGLMTQDDYFEASTKALSLFQYGQQVALEHGLILVDTKYEFGKGSDGTVLLIDEVHTPDSSRYWIADSYEERFEKSLEPDNIDKEFLRLWFKDHCNPYEDEVLPDAPEELVSELAWRYIFLYETITKSKFEMPMTKVMNRW
ncbi:phosphoribosylaminoimidazole-succinocarboxamide synthase, chloroplastic [Olea europaea subsp. europaea]|uniref:Phosphoribosylaminoimidazole-succinocarboxamide synthase, chloroplastic n=1 Tax=Olea europaea subsp. europaea TaxID=158383 RepID=A0A8S0V7X0_OLEEU|nr:phosphoribosylaminoimidazole-succinocarboxamide synthase, chloroplastic [Olea europaea subsp. europaea]